MVAYFSRARHNYVSGNIVDLPVDNTEVVAKMIRKIIGSDVFQIDPVTSYPEDYTKPPK